HADLSVKHVQVEMQIDSLDTCGKCRQCWRQPLCQAGGANLFPTYEGDLRLRKPPGVFIIHLARTNQQHLIAWNHRKARNELGDGRPAVAGGNCQTHAVEHAPSGSFRSVKVWMSIKPDDPKLGRVHPCDATQGGVAVARQDEGKRATLLGSMCP